MTDQTQNQKAARTAQRAAIIGAVLIMGLAAWASYVVRGSVLWYIMVPAAFAAACHYFGCAMFVRHFKSLDSAPSETDEP